MTTFQGYVDRVHKGLAFLILEGPDGQRLDITWDAAELAHMSIHERQPFTLQLSGSCDFVPDPPQPLSQELREQIKILLSHYQQ